MFSSFLVLVVLLLMLFAFVDTWYMLRSLIFFAPKRVWQVWFGGKRRLSREELLQTTTVHGIVLPSDLDFHFHMNNSKYLREMDFGRFQHYLQTHFFTHLRALGGFMVVATATIRYRRSLQLWDRFLLQTRLLGWEGNTMYLEQRFVKKRDGFVCAVALLSMSTVGVTVEKVLEKVCGYAPESPSFLPELNSLAETIARSKERFRKERTN